MEYSNYVNPLRRGQLPGLSLLAGIRLLSRFPFSSIGFQHTAFAFAYESMIADTKVYDEYLPPGTLVSYLQKALQYIELETHVREVCFVFSYYV